MQSGDDSDLAATDPNPIVARMNMFKEYKRHVVGPFYQHQWPMPYRPVDLSLVDDFFFQPLIHFPKDLINDCVAAALNMLFRYAYFTNRWQVHQLMRQKLKKGKKHCYEVKREKGYTLQMFDNVFRDVAGNLLTFRLVAKM